MLFMYMFNIKSTERKSIFLKMQCWIFDILEKPIIIDISIIPDFCLTTPMQKNRVAWVSSRLKTLGLTWSFWQLCHMYIPLQRGSWQSQVYLLRRKNIEHTDPPACSHHSLHKHELQSPQEHSRFVFLGHLQFDWVLGRTLVLLIHNPEIPNIQLHMNLQG